MSYYYSYYIGYEFNNKIYPLGAYDYDHVFCPVLEMSKSFASDLYELFNDIPENKISDELFSEFSYKNFNDEVELPILKYQYLKELPDDSFIRKGYFLVNDVQMYEKEHEYFEGFYDVLSPEVYAAKLQNEIMFGKNQPKKDDGGYEYTEPNASDYMYYAYPNYESREYEALLLRVMAYVFYTSLPPDAEMVIIETEG